ncbi:MAG: transcriptional regulator GlxA family with amidase domain [Cellvibrionaceae bacterium]|jgi:transcriptional regulator GlxA family with amidase domain
MQKHPLILTFALLTLLCNPAYAAQKVIGIIVYDGVLTSDITAPAEVFGVATKQSWFNNYEVKMIGINNQKMITTEEGLTIKVDSDITQAHKLSALIVPSSYDMQPLLKNKALISFIKKQASQVEWLASNCSGSYLLAEANLLNGKKATTWAGGESDLQKKYPSVLVQHNQNYVIDENIITSNGGTVSYIAAIKLLSLMSNKKLAQEVFGTLQMGRITNTY